MSNSNSQSNPTNSGSHPSNNRRSSYASVLAGSSSSHAPTISLSSLISSANPPPSYSMPLSVPSNAPKSTPSRQPDGGEWSRSLTNTMSSSQLPPQPADDKDEFFVPDYLEYSRYGQRLREEHEKQCVTSQKAARSRSTSQPASLSTSSSSINLQASMKSTFHRGLSHEVVENTPALFTSNEERLPDPLPAKWNGKDKGPGLELSAGGLVVKLASQLSRPHGDENGAAIRADHPMPSMAGIYYFEVTLLTKQRECLVSIGFMERKVVLNRMPGWEPNSWAFHGDDGKLYHNLSNSSNNNPKTYKESFHGGDVIGCGINFRTGTAFFTKNNHNLGTAFKDLRTDVAYYPAIGIKKQSEEIRVNFGQTPFVFDIKSIYDKDREAVLKDIRSTDTGNLYPPYSESALIHKFIKQYLSNEGYVKASRAFINEVNSESNFLTGKPPNTLYFTDNDDSNAVNRQKIRTSIMNGDIDSALILAESAYPLVLKKNTLIHFRLKCLKFVEMMRSSLEEQSRVDKRKWPKNSEYGDVFNHEMELDGAGSWGTMQVDEDGPTDVGSSKGKGRSVSNTDVFNYGQKLQAEYNKDTRKEVKDELRKTLGLIAYQNLNDSPLKDILDEKNRLEIAEDVNKLILIELGKGPSSALERMIQQTEVMLRELGDDGGPGALVNLQRDFMGHKF